MTGALTDHALVPVADEADARATATALGAHAFDQVTVVHVVEKGEGVPDKTPVEQSETIAREAIAAVREQFPGAGSELAYGRDVVEEITAVAAETEASAIVFRPRPGGRLRRWLSGDRSLRLVTETDRPVVVLPGGEE